MLRLAKALALENKGRRLVNPQEMLHEDPLDGSRGMVCELLRQQHLLEYWCV